MRKRTQIPLEAPLHPAAPLRGARDEPAPEACGAKWEFRAVAPTGIREVCADRTDVDSLHQSRPSAQFVRQDR